MNPDFPVAPTSARAAGADDEHTDLDWPHATGLTERVLRDVEIKVARRKRRRRQGGMAVLAVVTLISAGFTWRSLPRHNAAGPVASAVTAMVPEPALFTLSDGSSVERRDGAQVTPAFTATVRRVLLSRGQAHFEVRKDDPRPFVVVAGAVEVRAVGTAFAVRLESAAVEVVVTEGRVAVETAEPAADGESTATASAAGSRPDDSAIASPRVTLATAVAGDHVSVDLRRLRDTRGIAKVSPLSEFEIARRLGWRVPKLEFSATPLREAAAMLNRQGGVQIRVEPAFDDVRVSGVLRADNLDTLFRFLESEYGIKAERRDGNEVLLRQAK